MTWGTVGGNDGGGEWGGGWRGSGLGGAAGVGLHLAGDGGKMVGGMLRRGVIRFLRGLRDGGKVLLASCIGALSLVVNAYLVWSSGDWSGGPYYELYKEVITVTAATAGSADCDSDLFSGGGESVWRDFFGEAVCGGAGGGG